MIGNKDRLQYILEKVFVKLMLCSVWSYDVFNFSIPYIE